MQLAISLTNLNKSYNKPSVFFLKKNKSIKALDDVSFNCPANKITCLLGPNGAGKTTIIKILANLIIQDKGSIEFNDDNNKNVPYKNAKIGLMTPNERSFYWRLTGRQNLDFFADLYGYKSKIKKEIINNLLNDFDLTKEADKPFRFYSTGMKHKLLIIRALLGDPDIIILDEPTSHIDPIARENIHLLIKNKIIFEKKKTILMCTHDLEEAQSISDHLVLLNEGKVIAEGNYDKLEKMINPNIIFKIFFLKKPDNEFFKIYPEFNFKENEASEFKVKDLQSIPLLIKKAVEYDGEILWCKEQKEDLLSIFKRLTFNGEV